MSKGDPGKAPLPVLRGSPMRGPAKESAMKKRYEPRGLPLPEEDRAFLLAFYQQCGGIEAAQLAGVTEKTYARAMGGAPLYAATHGILSAFAAKLRCAS